MVGRLPDLPRPRRWLISIHGSHFRLVNAFFKGSYFRQVNSPVFREPASDCLKIDRAGETLRGPLSRLYAFWYRADWRLLFCFQAMLLMM